MSTAGRWGGSRLDVSHTFSDEGSNGYRSGKRWAHNRRDSRTTLSTHRKATGFLPTHTTLARLGVLQRISSKQRQQQQRFLYRLGVQRLGLLHCQRRFQFRIPNGARELESSNTSADKAAIPYLPKPTTCSKCEMMKCGLANGEHEISDVCRAAFTAEQAALQQYDR